MTTNFNRIILERKYLTKLNTDSFIKGIEVNEDDGTMSIITNKNGIDTTQVVHTGIPHLRYNNDTERITAERAIETTLNSFFLRDQHKMSSGAENIFFTNRNSNIDFFPVWQGIRDQSIQANQGVDGILKPTARIYSDSLFNLISYGNPLVETPIDFDETHTFINSTSAFGMEFITCEDINSSFYLLYIVQIGGREIYTQEFKNLTKSKGDTIQVWFTHPIETHQGQTASVKLFKKNSETDETIGLLQVEQAENLYNGQTIPYIKYFIRNFQDKEIALKDDMNLKYLGGWDASGNIPDISSLSPSNGSYFIVTNPGNYDSVSYEIGRAHV